jgi:hypothetical protein
MTGVVIMREASSMRAILRDALALQAKAPQDEGRGLWLRFNNLIPHPEGA